jgi:uncharacterized protein (UPF0264 family)
MKLLVSVASADEARAAADGGADVIDAKDPSMGALGPVEPEVFAQIRRAVGPERLVTAAVGDADSTGAEPLTREFVALGARLVKVGFASVSDARRVEEQIGGLADVCASIDKEAGVVAVAYADALAGRFGDAAELISIAARAGARGVLVDTADKNGLGLMGLWTVSEVSSWVGMAHDHGLFAAVAGKLSAGDLAAVSDAGADIAGVRGAACVGGRNGRVSSHLVRALRRSISQPASEKGRTPQLQDLTRI